MYKTLIDTLQHGNLPRYTQATPQTASSIVRYLWEEAYPQGAEPTEALRLFAEDIRYEDFNYPLPFLGKAAVTDFVTAFDIPALFLIKRHDSSAAALARRHAARRPSDAPSRLKRTLPLCAPLMQPFRPGARPTSFFTRPRARGVRRRAAEDQVAAADQPVGRQQPTRYQPAAADPQVRANQGQPGLAVWAPGTDQPRA